MIPLVLAGGLGTRARPLTANRPKPLLPLVNRPLIEHVLLHLRRCGFDRAEVLTHHDAAAIREALGDGTALGVRVAYRHEDRDVGTAGAAARSAAATRARTSLVVSADVICAFDLRSLVATHRARRARASIAVTRVPDPLQFGIMILDRHGLVRRFLEKPTWGEVFSDTVNAGVFVLERPVLARAGGDSPVDFAADLFPRLLAEGVPLHGIEAEGYWRDVGDPESYLAAHLDFFRGVLPVEPPGDRSETSGAAVWMGPGVAIEPGAELRGRVVLGRGCRIGAGARLEDVVLGDGTVVGAGADLRRAVAWRDVRFGEHARVEGSVLCDRVEVGPDAVVEAGAIVGDGTRLGRESRVKEGVRIWPDKVVEDHAVVHSNLVHAARWRTSAFEEGAVTGLTNLELTPEVAARLGAAYGTLLKPGSTALSVRDAHPASRMLRRAFFGGVGSTGVHMVDLGLLPVPVMRHKLESIGEQGGVSFQQVPQLRGMTSIRFFDGDGLDISTSFSKSIERVFLREEFRRVQHEEIGAIFELPRILDFYAEAFLRALDVQLIRSRRLRLVVDYAHSAAAVVLPRLLGDLGCDVVTLNAHIEGSPGPAADSDAEVDRQRLASIVRSLGADLGVWLHPSGERLALADRDGRVWSDMELTALVVAMVCAADLPPGELALPVYVPSTFARALEAAGHRLLETLSAPRALTEASRRHRVLLASSGEGDLLWPALHHAPDAMFALGKVIELLARSGQPLERYAPDVPRVTVARASIECPMDRKGEVMRRWADGAAGPASSYLDGLKVTADGGWVLLRPDRVLARLHLHAEGPTGRAAARLVARYRRRIEALVRGGAGGKSPSRVPARRRRDETKGG